MEMSRKKLLVPTKRIEIEKFYAPSPTSFCGYIITETKVSVISIKTN